MRWIWVVAGALGALALATVVALRSPGTELWLEDLPVIGSVFGWLGELIGSPRDESVELRYRADHPEQLAHVQLPDAEVRGDTLVVTARDGRYAYELRDRLARRPAPMPAYIVVYQSDELTALQRALRRDDQAKKLGIAVELDHVGYHLQVATDGLYVNPDWAEQHHCDTGDRIVGTGVYCLPTGAERLTAYVKGDPGLFTDPHPIELPPQRTFLPDDDVRNERFYEVVLPAISLEVTAALPRGDSLEVTARLPALAPDVELAVQIGGKLYVATPRPGGLAIATGGVLADDLATSYALAAAGLHELR